MEDIDTALQEAESMQEHIEDIQARLDALLERLDDVERTPVHI